MIAHLGYSVPVCPGGCYGGLATPPATVITLRGTRAPASAPDNKRIKLEHYERLSSCVAELLEHWLLPALSSGKTDPPPIRRADMSPDTRRHLYDGDQEETALW